MCTIDIALHINATEKKKTKITIGPDTHYSLFKVYYVINLPLRDLLRHYREYILGWV
jgi:hypothetical protein